MTGLEEVQDSVWNVIYYDTPLGRFDERTRTITGAPSLKKDCERCPRTKCHLSFRLFNPLCSRIKLGTTACTGPSASNR